MREFVKKWEVLITVIISITSIFLATKANEMTKVQTEVARNSSLPNIQVVEEEECEGTYDSVIEISNLEGKINNYSSRIVTFLSCSYIDAEDDFYEEEIPIFNYYIIGTESGKNIGVLEKRATGGNSVKINKLLQTILEYNKRTSESLYVEINSYLCISYIDVLGENQKIYYRTNLHDSKLINEEEGQRKIEIYDKLFAANEGIDPNRSNEIDVQLLVNKIYDISNMNINELEESKTIQGKVWGDVMIEIIGVFLASGLAHMLWLLQEKKKDKDSKSHASSILYYDLISIETYLEYERSSVNLRYSSEWQRMIANCPFLKEEQVKTLYSIYDNVYNYNYFYRLKEIKKEVIVKEDIPQYKILKDIFLEKTEDNQRYRELLEELRKHIITNKN